MQLARGHRAGDTAVTLLAGLLIMSAVRRLTVALTVSAGIGLAMAGPVAAECIYAPPWPPVTEAIPTARVIVLGAVVTDFPQDELGLSSGEGPRDRALRITEVLRGDVMVESLMDVQFFQSNWPWTLAADGSPYPPCTPLSLPDGDVIVLALEALQPGGEQRDESGSWVQPPTRYNAVGWISGSSGPMDREVVTLEQVRALATLPATDTEGVASRAGPSIILLLLVGATLGVVSSFRPGGGGPRARPSSRWYVSAIAGRSPRRLDR